MITTAPSPSPAIDADPTRHPRLRRFLAERTAVLATIFIVLLVVMALFPGLFASKSPTDQSLAARFVHPGHSHLLGTDDLGRDQLSRVVHGARTSLLAGLQGTGIAFFIGVPLGMLAAFYDSWRRTVLDRVVDGMMSVPALLLAIVIVAVLGPSLVNAMLGVGLAFSPRFYRVARAATLDVREETFIEAATAIGCSNRRTIVHHVLPNITSTVIIQAALTVASVIMAEASLSFLGLGVQPPTPSWGGMLQQASQSLYDASFLLYGPLAMIVLTVLAFQFAADGLRAALAGSSLRAEER